MNLLLVEDDTVLADALQQQLSRASFKVEWADNGAVAEYLLRKQDFDIAVLDLGLPMVDGLTVLKRVREAGRSLPILVLTALDALEHRVAGLQAGADDYLTKPFDFPDKPCIRVSLFYSHFTQGSDDFAEFYILRAFRRTGITLDTQPDYR